MILKSQMANNLSDEKQSLVHESLLKNYQGQPKRDTKSNTDYPF